MAEESGRNSGSNGNKKLMNVWTGEDLFQCDCCGLCCMQVSRSLLYADLDRGDGICRFFDCNTKLCRIYECRPIKCNIEKSYHLYFIGKMSKQDYYNYNYEACRKLKQSELI